MPAHSRQTDFDLLEIMKFAETKDVITIPNYKNVFVYFLLLNKEVVYVGQTRNGLVRPLSHKDKVFDEIKIMYCKEKDLDLTEDLYIKKYMPYYNKNANYNMNYSLHRARNKIRSLFNDNSFNLPKLKRIIKALNIQVYMIDSKPYINVEDYKKIVEHINERGIT